MSDDEYLYKLARNVASTLTNPDKKQLRFNDIVSAAKLFYANNPEAGILELVQACDKDNHALYVKGCSMHESLRLHYGWMIPVE